MQNLEHGRSSMGKATYRLRLFAMASINKTYKTFNPAASEPKSDDRLAKSDRDME